MSKPTIGVSAPALLTEPASLVTALVLLLLPPILVAQQVRPEKDVHTLASLSAIDHQVLLLPDAPRATDYAAIAPNLGMLNMQDAEHQHPLSALDTLTAAANTDKYIAPRQTAPKLRVRDKVVLGLKDAGSANTIFAATVAAGISHADNSSPQYGTNSSAYAQRFGSAMARGGSYSIFSDSILASVLHDDPRYYRMGKGHTVVKRLAYAMTRPLISRTDGGRLTPNLPLIGGHLGAAYMTKLYYPSQNTSTAQVYQTFGFSFMGSAIDYGINEFLPGALNILHNSRRVDE